jgi:folate-dependent tRNA-U54 methylase TrmFO/GidA
MKLSKTVWAAAAAAVLMSTALSAHAQTKKELVQKLISIQQASLESTAKGLAEAPARQLVAAAQPILAQGVAPEKREATAKLVDAEIKKYLDAAGPIVRASTIKMSQGAISSAIDEKFTEDELKQLVVMLDSPVLKKYQTVLPDLSKALVEQVVQDARPQVDPKLQAAQEAIRKILDKATDGKLSQAAAQQQAQQQGSAPAAAPAAKPKGK